MLDSRPVIRPILFESEYTRVPEALGTQFTSRFAVVAHRANDSTGMSATPLRWQEQGETRYTLSIRSTEFNDYDKGGDYERDKGTGISFATEPREADGCGRIRTGTRRVGATIGHAVMLAASRRLVQGALWQVIALRIELRLALDPAITFEVPGGKDPCAEDAVQRRRVAAQRDPGPEAPDRGGQGEQHQCPERHQHQDKEPDVFPTLAGSEVLYDQHDHPCHEAGKRRRQRDELPPPPRRHAVRAVGGQDLLSSLHGQAAEGTRLEINAAVARRATSLRSNSGSRSPNLSFSLGRIAYGSRVRVRLGRAPTPDHLNSVRAGADNPI
jgi:hypothetical protein